MVLSLYNSAIAFGSEADLTKASLIVTALTEANLRGADLSGAVLRDAELDYAVLIHTGLCNKATYLDVDNEEMVSIMEKVKV